MSLQMSSDKSGDSNSSDFDASEKGLRHWWLQRVTAIALIPLTLWFAFSVNCIAGAEYKTVITELASPLNACLIIALIIVAFYHAALGMQVVFEDYVSTIKTRFVCILLSNISLLLLAIAGIYAVIRIAFGDQ